jgi:hypothetical protein
MIIASDLLPNAESISKDRFTYPTVAPNPHPLRLCVRQWSAPRPCRSALCVFAPLRETLEWRLVRLRLTAKRKLPAPFASLRLCVSPRLQVPLHIPYGRTQPTSFASLRETLEWRLVRLRLTAKRKLPAPLRLCVTPVRPHYRLSPIA